MKTLNFLYAVMFYALVRSLVGQSLVRVFLSLTLTVAVAFFFPGWAPDISGPNNIPSVSGTRFLPSLVILTLVVLTDLFRPKCLRLVCFHIFLNFLSAVSILWSSESAVYTACIWGPLIGFLAYKEASQTTRFNFRLFLKHICIQIAYLSGFLLGWFFLVVQRLNDLDLSAFGEYAAMYAGGVGGLPIELDGSFWFLLFFLMSSKLASLRRAEIKPRLLVSYFF